MATFRIASLLLAAALWLPAPHGRADAAVVCAGDCNGDGMVAVNELVTGVGIALGQQELSGCAVLDRNGDGEVSIDELLAAVAAALTGCPAAPTPTSTGPPTGTAATPATATPTDRDTPTGTVSPTATAPASATATGTGAATATPTPEPSSTATDAPTGTATTAPSATTTATAAEPTATRTVTVTPSPTPFGTASDLAVAIDAGEVRLAWMNPAPGGGYTHARLMRRLNAPVAGPQDPDADEVFFGAAANAAHPLGDLLPDVPENHRTYHYAVFACTASGACGPSGAAATLTPTLPEALRGGGYIVHWRHASADVCGDRTNLGTAANPIVPDWWKSCEASCPNSPTGGPATARQLNDAGRAESVAIGEAFDILRIPVGRMLSSEFCRNVETAELMDLGAPIEQLPSITFFVYDEANRCANSYDLLAEAPAAGTNTAIIGHAGFAPPCAILGTLAWAEAAIFKPDGEGGTAFVTRVTDDEWDDLLPAGPSALSANVEETHVRLTWNNGPAYPRVRLLRRLNAPVEGPQDPDATLIFSGVTDTVLDPVSTLLPSAPGEARTYHYAVYGCVGAACEDVGSATMVTPTLAQLLRAGGYVIHFRHASALLCQDRTDLGTAAETTVPDWWKSCDATCPSPPGVITATARQLTAIGRDEAAIIGAAFDAQGFPVGRVISSEFCRTRQTAELMDFGPPIEESPAITFFVYDEAARCANTFALLSEKPAAGSNTAIVGHVGNVCPPISNLANAGAVIYRPDGNGGTTFIATVNFQQWATLP